jgi:phenylalanyl-tRNA synthetase alpha subunit
MIKQILLFAFAVLLLAACSTPKYTYNFSHHNYYAGKKENAEKQNVQQVNEPNEAIASTENTILETKEVVATPAVATVSKETIKKTLAQLSKEERKELKKEIKTELKQYVKALKKADAKSVQEVQNMDKDLKMAAIFGSVGLVLTFLGGVNSVFWVLGVISLVIGTVFFIRWLSRQ